MALSLPVSNRDEYVACTSCVADLEHCHGVAIESEGAWSCSDDPDCRLAPEFHEFIAHE